MMISTYDKMALIWAILSNPRMALVKPSINWFLLQYLRKFQITKAGKHYIIHSHLPPINSKAYKRFIDEHLLARIEGPSHAQIGLTNACPQNCAYCYNKDRKGRPIDKNTIIQTVQALKRMGVFWIGFTGGEPLLNKDILEIAESIGDDCAIKLFTTGYQLSPAMAKGLIDAGIFSVSVSLDHWRQTEHDRVRRCKGAFRMALKAVEVLKEAGDIHLSVSAVLTHEMIRKAQVEEFIMFLIQLGVQEAWLSEAKPSVASYWSEEMVISEQDRLALCALQDRYNKTGKITVNYLAHFEGKEHFGCNAGHKMVYVDAFGEVSPCVFTPITFGNVRDRHLEEIFGDMKKYFSSSDSCFMNHNYKHLKTFENLPVTREETIKMLQDVRFGPYSKFFRLYYS